MSRSPNTPYPRFNSLAKDHAESQLQQATLDMENERKRVSLIVSLTPYLPLTLIPIRSKSERREACLQYNLQQTESHVDDLELSLEQVKAVHAVAQRESKKTLRLCPLNPSPHPSTKPLTLY